MTEVLSQEKIDDLLDEEKSRAAAERGRVKIYDFKRPDKFTLDQIRTVAIIHEAFARLLTASLSAQLRIMAHVHLAGVDQLTYEEFIRSVPNPDVLAVIGMEPLKGTAVLEINPAVAFCIIDRLFGGRGEATRLTRELTDIEVAVISGLIPRLLGNLAAAWAGVIGLRPGLSHVEINPQFAQIVPPSEMVILVMLEARIGAAGGVKAMMNLVLPYLTIEPIIAKLSTQYWYSFVRRNDNAPAATPADLEISSEVYMAGEKLPLRDLGRLRKGSLVRIADQERGGAFLRVGGCPLLRLETGGGGRGKPAEYSVSGEIGKTGMPFASRKRKPEPPEWETGIRQALREVGAGIGSSLAEMKNAISELTHRQDEMADQLAFGSQAQEADAQKNAARGRPFDFLERSNPIHLVSFLQIEHPQTIALIVAHLEPRTASVILGSLPPEMQPDVARRIATMDRIAPEVIRVVEGVLEKKLSALSAEEYAAAGGVESIVEILNISSRSVEKLVVETLEKEDAELAEEIKRRMFVFEDITLLGRETAVMILRKIDSEDLLRAMKTTPEEVRSFIWGCVPQGEAEKLRQRFQDLGRVRLSEVDAAQQRIIGKIREMDEAGEIIVARPGETIG